MTRPVSTGRGEATSPSTPITTILFDLDGTLLPMDQDVFAKAYFAGLARKAQPYGYEADRLIQTIWAGTAAMIRNRSAYSNEHIFWETFVSAYGEEARKDIGIFDEYYVHDFDRVKETCGFDPQVAPLIHRLQERGFRLILATNPIFPRVATECRIRWAGLSPDDFSHITTFENSYRCKPNPEYYRQLLRDVQIAPEECLMVGNDVEEDMEAAASAGMQGFLLTDCLINRRGASIDCYPRGGFHELMAYVKRLDQKA